MPAGNGLVRGSSATQIEIARPFYFWLLLGRIADPTPHAGRTPRIAQNQDTPDDTAPAFGSLLLWCGLTLLTLITGTLLVDASNAADYASGE